MLPEEVEGGGVTNSMTPSDLETVEIPRLQLNGHFSEERPPCYDVITRRGVTGRQRTQHGRRTRKNNRNIVNHLGSRGGAVVRVLSSHQCGPGSIPGPGVIRGLSLLLILSLFREVFL